MESEDDIKAKAAARIKSAKAGIAAPAEGSIEVRGPDDIEAEMVEHELPAEGSIEVRGPDGGRHRAGYKFTPVAVVIPLADLTDKQRALIERDPVLSVKYIAADEA